MFQARITESKFFTEVPKEEFKRGSLYVIVAMQNDRALQLHSDMIIGEATPKPEENLNQLWFVRARNDSDRTFQIIHFGANMYLCHDSNYASVRAQLSKIDGLYFLEQYDEFEGHMYYTISTVKSESSKITRTGFSLSLSEFLQPKLSNPLDQKQLFRFIKINERQSKIKQINANCIIVHATSGKVLDVPRATNKDDENVVVWPKSRRLHQRWNFKKLNEGNNYEIRNVATEKYLAIASEARTTNSKIVQFRRTGLTNQSWLLENVGNGLFVIRSAHEESLMLGLYNGSAENGNSVAVVNQDCFWRIDGYYQR